MEDSKELKKDILEKISTVDSHTELQNLKVVELGKKGRISLLMKSLGSLSIEDKKRLGKEYNILRQDIIQEFEKKYKELDSIEINKKISDESSDITLPVRNGNFDEEGKIHPITGTIDKIISIFSSFFHAFFNY